MERHINLELLMLSFFLFLFPDIFNEAKKKTQELAAQVWISQGFSQILYTESKDYTDYCPWMIVTGSLSLPA